MNLEKDIYIEILKNKINEMNEENLVLNTLLVQKTNENTILFQKIENLKPLEEEILDLREEINALKQQNENIGEITLDCLNDNVITLSEEDFSCRD